MDNILIDSDIVLDAFLDRKPFSHAASKVLTLCERGHTKGFVTPVIISNVYYITRKSAVGHDGAIKSLKALMNIVDVIATNKEVILEALYSHFRDFEDAIQNYSAQSSQKISTIITRNTKDFKSSNLLVVTPEDYLKQHENQDLKPF